MATLSVRSIAAECLGKSAPLSLLKDIFGVYGSNPQIRSLKNQLDLIRNKWFLRVAVVTIRPVGSTLGAYANLQRDLDNANLVFQTSCDIWIYCVGSIVEFTNILGQGGIIDQDDCIMGGFLGIGDHDVSMEEWVLFELGRNLGASIVCYYINGDNVGNGGCAAHPDGRHGFWVSVTESSPWTFAHELSHVLGNDHVGDRDNLMFGDGTSRITNLPPDLSGSQCGELLLAGSHFDSAMERCGSD